MSCPFFHMSMPKDRHLCRDISCHKCLLCNGFHAENHSHEIICIVADIMVFINITLLGTAHDWVGDDKCNMLICKYVGWFKEYLDSNTSHPNMWDERLQIYYMTLDICLYKITKTVICLLKQLRLAFSFGCLDVRKLQVSLSLLARGRVGYEGKQHDTITRVYYRLSLLAQGRVEYKDK